MGTHDDVYIAAQRPDLCHNLARCQGVVDGDDCHPCLVYPQVLENDLIGGVAKVYRHLLFPRFMDLIGIELHDYKGDMCPLCGQRNIAPVEAITDDDYMVLELYFRPFIGSLFGLVAAVDDQP